MWDSFWRTWHTSQDATKEAVVLSWQCRSWICVFAVIFASQTLLWSAWCMIFKKHFANSVSLFASEFSTGHHAFDDIPIRKAGLTSGVSKNKRLKGSMQGLVEDVQGAESSHLTTFPPGCQHHGNHFFDLSLSDFVVDGLSLVKFASDISWYFLGPDTLWSTLCLQELLASAESPAGSIKWLWRTTTKLCTYWKDVTRAPTMNHSFPKLQEINAAQKMQKTQQARMIRGLFVFGCLTPNTRIAWSRSGDKRWLTWPVPWFAPRGRGVVNYQVSSWLVLFVLLTNTHSFAMSRNVVQTIYCI